MAKVLVFQHVPYEPLGTLDPLLRKHKHRIRYVNFSRKPDYIPNVEGYDALIILGGPMNLGQEQDYPHLIQEQIAIRKAADLGIPILGICLGAQLIASALGGKVYPAKEKEIGWVPLNTTADGGQDAIVQHLRKDELIFQWHGYTFDLPENAVHLIEGDVCRNQAFKIGSNIYGFQFHLEVSLKLIHRWLNLPAHQQELGLDSNKVIERIWQQTRHQIDRSTQLSHLVFSSFLDLIPKVNQQYVLRHSRRSDFFPRKHGEQRIHKDLH